MSNKALENFIPEAGALKNIYSNNNKYQKNLIEKSSGTKNRKILHLAAQLEPKWHREDGKGCKATLVMSS